MLVLNHTWQQVLCCIASLEAACHWCQANQLRCRYLDKAVAVILAFIGGKIILDEIPGGFHVSVEGSLLFVATALGVGVAASLLNPEEKPEPEVSVIPSPPEQLLLKSSRNGGNGANGGNGGNGATEARVEEEPAAKKD